MSDFLHYSGRRYALVVAGVASLALIAIIVLVSHSEQHQELVSLREASSVHTGSGRLSPRDLLAR